RLTSRRDGATQVGKGRLPPNPGHYHSSSVGWGGTEASFPSLAPCRCLLFARTAPQFHAWSVREPGRPGSEPPQPELPLGPRSALLAAGAAAPGGLELTGFDSYERFFGPFTQRAFRGKRPSPVAEGVCREKHAPFPLRGGFPWQAVTDKNRYFH